MDRVLSLKSPGLNWALPTPSGLYSSLVSISINNAEVVLVVKHNVGYITSHPSINVLQQPQLPVGMAK